MVEISDCNQPPAPVDPSCHVSAFSLNKNIWALQVYISCSVLMCDMNSRFSRCAQGCLQSSPSSRRKRESGMETFKHSIIQGPMQFAKRDIPVEKGINSVVVKQSDVLAEG